MYALDSRPVVQSAGLYLAVVVSRLASSAVGGGVEGWSAQPKAAAWRYDMMMRQGEVGARCLYLEQNLYDR